MEEKKQLFDKWFLLNKVEYFQNKFTESKKMYYIVENENSKYFVDPIMIKKINNLPLGDDNDSLTIRSHLINGMQKVEQANLDHITGSKAVKNKAGLIDYNSSAIQHERDYIDKRDIGSDLRLAKNELGKMLEQKLDELLGAVGKIATGIVDVYSQGQKRRQEQVKNYKAQGFTDQQIAQLMK